MKSINSKKNNKSTISQKSSLAKSQQEILNQLMSFGISEKVAKQLVETLDLKYIEEWLKIIPYAKFIKDKGAYLVKVLQERMPIPEILFQAKAKAEEKKELDEYYNSLPEETKEKIDEFVKEKVRRNMIRLEILRELHRDPNLLDEIKTLFEETKKLCQFFYFLTNQSTQEPTSRDLEVASFFLLNHERNLFSAQHQLFHLVGQLNIVNQLPKTFNELEEYLISF